MTFFIFRGLTVILDASGTGAIDCGFPGFEFSPLLTPLFFGCVRECLVYFLGTGGASFFFPFFSSVFLRFEVRVFFRANSFSYEQESQFHFFPDFVSKPFFFFFFFLFFFFSFNLSLPAPCSDAWARFG